MKSDKKEYILYDSVNINCKQWQRRGEWLFASDTKVWRTTMDSDGYVCYLVCGNGFIGVHICQNYQIVFFKYMYFSSIQP